MMTLFDLIPKFIFFFFKQKTAYEMRISDWSSDVCSSDLEGRARATVSQDRLHPLFADHSRQCQGGGSAARRGGRDGLAPEQHRIYRRQIGRASCRERVCQYV